MDAGVERVVYLSFMGAAPDATFTFARDHWATEQHAHALGLTTTFLRDGVYADDLASVRDLYERRASQGRVEADLARLARAATFGAVDTVLVDIDDVVPGSVDEETARHPMFLHVNTVITAVWTGSFAATALLASGPLIASAGSPEEPRLAEINMAAVLKAAQIDPQRPDQTLTDGAAPHVRKVERELASRGLLDRDKVEHGSSAAA